MDPTPTQPHRPVRSGDFLDRASGFLQSELNSVNGILTAVVDSESSLIREVAEYISFTGGKKLRPMLTLLTARGLGGQCSPPVHLASAMEAIHVATLLHDDVIDRAPVRRGQASVNARWGDDIAILMADYLFAAAFDLALQHVGPEPLRLLTRVTRNMCEGEIYQIERRQRWLTQEDYLYLISCKTAYLFSACCALGAMHAGLDESTIEAAASFGLDFGLAFQITDDTLDYTAVDEHWGKPVGIDLTDGKQTIPLILAHERASEADRRRLEAIMNDGRDLASVRELLNRYGAIESSLEMARHYAGQASQRLQAVPGADPEAFSILESMPGYVVGRAF